MLCLRFLGCLGCLDNSNMFSQSSGSCRSEIRVPAWPISRVDSLPGLQTAIFSVSSHDLSSVMERESVGEREREREEASMLCLLLRALILGSHLTKLTSLEALSPKTATLGLVLQRVSFVTHNILPITLTHKRGANHVC